MIDRSLNLVKMLRVIIRKNIQGMTTMEVIIVLVITAILAAVSIPSLDTMMKRAELNTAVDNVEGIISEAISYAVRSSDSCFIRLNNAYGAPLQHLSLSSPRDAALNPCVVSSRTIEAHVRVVPTGGATYVDVGVNLSGAVDNTSPIVIESNKLSDKRCLILTLISSAIKGQYDSSTSTCVPD